jgi:hypothetical protein
MVDLDGVTGPGTANVAVTTPVRAGVQRFLLEVFVLVIQLPPAGPTVAITGTVSTDSGTIVAGATQDYDFFSHGIHTRVHDRLLVIDQPVSSDIRTSRHDIELDAGPVAKPAIVKVNWSGDSVLGMIVLDITNSASPAVLRVYNGPDSMSYSEVLTTQPHAGLVKLRIELTTKKTGSSNTLLDVWAGPETPLVASTHINLAGSSSSKKKEPDPSCSVVRGSSLSFLLFVLLLSASAFGHALRIRHSRSA